MPLLMWITPYIRFGSKADMCSAVVHVCFGPIAEMEHFGGGL